jgi:hypothetical protein
MVPGLCVCTRDALAIIHCVAAVNIAVLLLVTGMAVLLRSSTPRSSSWIHKFSILLWLHVAVLCSAVLQVGHFWLIV